MKNIVKTVCLIVVAVLCCVLFMACTSDTDEAEVATQAPLPTVAPEELASATPQPTLAPDVVPETIVEPDSEGAVIASAVPQEPSDTEDDGEAESSSSGVLKEESEGDEVTSVQERLQELGYLDKATGYYGTDTVAAVEAFQEKNGLTVDGMIGSETMGVLMGDGAVSAS